MERQVDEDELGTLHGKLDRKEIPIDEFYKWLRELTDHPGKSEAAADMEINPDFHYIQEGRGNEWSDLCWELEVA